MGQEANVLPDGLEQLEGIVDRIVFVNKTGDYAVFRLKLEGQRGMATVTMNGPLPLAGQQLILQGIWKEHAKYGSQFEAHKMQVVAPTSIEGIERYLLASEAEGMTAALAKKITKAFGLETLDVLENHPSRLTEIPRLGKKRAEKIVKAFRENAEQRQVMAWLEEHNVSGTYAGIIFHTFGSSSIRRMTENPYCLAQEVKGISFTICDTIAASMGMAAEDDERIISGLEYQLIRLSNEGHCCVPEKYLVQTTAKLLKINEGMVHEVLQKALSMGLLEQESVGDTVYVYNTAFYEAEKFVADTLLYLRDNAKSFRVNNVSELVKKWEAQSAIELADLQREAVERAITEGVLVLTGGPGTGKTTVIRGMLEILAGENKDILLGAPTGRAAKRLSEATDRNAYTIHRMLEANSNDEEEPFGRNYDNPLEADVIILDEVSMMDIMLMSAFLEAVPEGCHVIFVGDVDQLPSVGPGSVLKDILRSEQVPQVRLSEIFRQAETSNIVINAHAINKGRTPLENMKQKDFYFREIDEPQVVENDVIHMVCDILPSRGYPGLDDWQVLSPMHRGFCGVERLNSLLQQALNPKTEDVSQWELGDRIFRAGDKIMQMKNNYEKEVFNGDIGYIDEITKHKMKVYYNDDLIVEYDKAEAAEQLQLAYCISVHKSQGSEYRAVIMPLVKGHFIMLQRNLLYTAITRARDLVILEGTKAALITAVENDKTRLRYSLLTERLCEAL